MPDNRYEEFRHTLPYASELFGVYQPLLGWRGKQAKRRVCKEQLALAEHVVKGMLNDSRVRGLVQDEVRLLGPDVQLPPRIPRWLNSVAANRVQLEVEEFIRANQRVPVKGDWTNILHTASARVNEKLNVHASEVSPAVALTASPDLQVSTSPLQESVAFGILDFLHQRAPETFQALFVESQRPWEITASFINPLSNFDTDIQNAVLSPIGLIHLYREFFFELGTFLGPPVGHVWVSPGGTMELFEIHTRRTLVERQIETALEVTRRTELTTTQQEELSEAIKQENQQNESFGIRAGGGMSTPVYHAEASVDFGLDTTQTSAAETAHKQLRQQTEKLSNEIKQLFKATFRTSVEVQDTSSRRYVLQNNTDKLVNYELRRKMRKVGVQVQDIGIQLCWQVYIDRLGQELGIAELVHVAKPDDVASGIQPPEAPPTLPIKQTDYSVSFDFFSTKNTEQSSDDDDYWRWVPPDQLADGGDENADRILAVREYSAPPPAPGYTLKSVNVKAYRGSRPDKDQPSASVELPGPVTGPDKFQIVLKHVNFEENPTIKFDMQLIWDPPDQTAAWEEFKRKDAEFRERERREAHADYVRSVGERVEQARKVSPRPADDLRAEERSVVYRRLIQKLTQTAPDQDPHVTAELIRAIFDVDKMLYFVAPDWWMPRRYIRPSRPGPTGGSNVAASTSPGRTALLLPTGTFIPPDQATRLTENDLVGWDGLAPKDRENNYLITEDSEPARMGASLGWLLQLDGDSHRNAFLNSPWVKAVFPIHPGKEKKAIEWLKQPHVEGSKDDSDGLKAQYTGHEPEFQGKSVEEVLLLIAEQIAQRNDIQHSLATETVFEKGFDPMEGGFRAPDLERREDRIFDQWIEILPVPDQQVVAVEYKPEERQ